MSEANDTPWYRLGFALESARRSPTPKRLRTLGERLAAFREEGKSGGSDGDGKSKDGAALIDDLVSGSTAALAVRALQAWPSRGRARWSHVVRATLAGAGATLLRELTAPMLQGRFERPRIEDGLGSRLLSGAARGALYGSFIEPRLPGPPVVRGVIYGSAEYLVGPWGGLPGVLGSFAPWRRIPGVSSIIDDAETGEDGWIEHLVFGIAVALLAGAAVDLSPLLGEDEDGVFFSDES